jgi:5-oxoprolinase (ATP-hydrolysing)
VRLSLTVPSLYLQRKTYSLASFGGAGGQHACEIASLLGIKTILIHRYSSVLSAYGLALADRFVFLSPPPYLTSNSPLSLFVLSAYEVQEPCSTFYTPQNKPTLLSRLDRMTADVRSELRKQGFEEHRIHVERMLNMRFEGTDTALMVLPHADDGEGDEDFESAFKRVYKAEFGFLLEKSVIVDDIKVISSFLLMFPPTKLMIQRF